RAVGIVLETLDDPGDAVLVAPEVDGAVLLPRAAADVTRRDAAGVIAGARLALRAGERHVGAALVQVRAVDLDDRAGAGRCGLVLDERHVSVPISPAPGPRSRSTGPGRDSRKPSSSPEYGRHACRSGASCPAR